MLCIGLILLKYYFFSPIDWAKAHPGQTVTISLRMLFVAPMLILLGVWWVAGFSKNIDTNAGKRLGAIMGGAGVCIGFLLKMELESIINKIATGH